MVNCRLLSIAIADVVVAATFAATSAIANTGGCSNAFDAEPTVPVGVVLTDEVTHRRWECRQPPEGHTGWEEIEGIDREVDPALQQVGEGAAGRCRSAIGEFDIPIGRAIHDSQGWRLACQPSGWTLLNGRPAAGIITALTISLDDEQQIGEDAPSLSEASAGDQRLPWLALAGLLAGIVIGFAASRLRHFCAALTRLLVAAAVLGTRWAVNAIPAAPRRRARRGNSPERRITTGDAGESARVEVEHLPTGAKRVVQLRGTLVIDASLKDAAASADALTIAPPGRAKLGIYGTFQTITRTGNTLGPYRVTLTASSP